MNGFEEINLMRALSMEFKNQEESSADAEAKEDLAEPSESSEESEEEESSEVW